MTGAVSIKEVSHALDLVDLCILMIHNSIVHIYSKKIHTLNLDVYY